MEILKKKKSFFFFKVQGKNYRKTPFDGNTENGETVVPWKYLSKFWRTLEVDN